MLSHPAYQVAMDGPPQGPGQGLTLARIMTAARAGSLDHASALFIAAGFDRATDDPAALAVAGRLARDRALRRPVAERAGLLRAAAGFYARAHALDPQPHTLISQATLALLAGDGAGAQSLAGQVLATLDHGPAPRETAYWIAATRAEAHLLRGETAAAQAWFERAIAHAPDSHDDLAVTLRQFALILAHQGQPDGWLDRHRPPRALNFAGHLAIGDHAVAPLAADVGAFLAEQGIGAGFGALAAGADLVIAQALLDHGAAVHVVLPTAPDVFAAQSVVPYGPAWVARFEHVLARVASLRQATSVSGAYEPRATHLAADVAMGAAVRHARRFETGAVQLLVIDDGPGRFGLGQATAYLGGRWGEAPRRSQVCMVVPRSAPVIASGRKPAEGRDDRMLAAMVHVTIDGLEGLDDTAFAAAVDTLITPFRAASAGIAPVPGLVMPAGHARILAFADPDEAWRHAAALLALPGHGARLRIAAHYALVHRFDAPAALGGPGLDRLASLGPVALPGVVTASDAFAAAVFVNQAGRIHAEEIGQWRGETLFALTQAE